LGCSVLHRWRIFEEEFCEREFSRGIEIDGVSGPGYMKVTHHIYPKFFPKRIHCHTIWTKVVDKYVFAEPPKHFSDEKIN